MTPSWSGLKKRLQDSPVDARVLIEPDSSLITTTRQSELLGVPRRSLYYHPVVNPEREVLDKLHMNAIDAIYTAYPFYGSRRMKVELE